MGGFKDLALNWRCLGVWFQGSSLEWEGVWVCGFKVLAMNGTSLGWCFQGSNFEWGVCGWTFSRL